MLRRGGPKTPSAKVPSSRIPSPRPLRTKTLTSRTLRFRTLSLQTLSLKRPPQALAVAFLALLMLGAEDPTSRFNRVGHKMICACSCGQVLLECNHVGCPDSARMINELQAQVSGGSADTSILNWFANKYGATVLAAPMRGGFDDVAWIAPFAVFILATFGTAILVKVWKRRTDRLIPIAPGPRYDRDSGLSGLEDLRKRIRRETEL